MKDEGSRLAFLLLLASSSDEQPNAAQGQAATHGQRPRITFQPQKRSAPWQGRHQATARRKTSEALMPPKPKELESTTSRGRARPTLGT